MSGFSNTTQSTSSGFPPASQGFLAWTFDPAIAYTTAQTFTPTVGVAYYEAMYLTAGTTVSNITTYLSSAGAGVANSWVGLYSATAQLGQSAVITTAWQSAGSVSVALSSPVVIPSTGVYYVAILVGTSTSTSPIFRVVGSSSGYTNQNLTATAGSLTLRSQTLGSSLAALPSSISGTPTGIANLFFVALS